MKTLILSPFMALASVAGAAALIISLLMGESFYRNSIGAFILAFIVVTMAVW